MTERTNMTSTLRSLLPKTDSSNMGLMMNESQVGSSNRDQGSNANSSGIHYSFLQRNAGSVVAPHTFKEDGGYSGQSRPLGTQQQTGLLKMMSLVCEGSPSESPRNQAAASTL